jgi:hypothetical protein
MKVIEHNPNRLVLSYQRVWWHGLLIGTIFILGGFFFFLVSLVSIEQAKGLSILLCGMSILSILSGILWIIKFPKVTTFTFDKSNNSVCWEQRTFPSQPAQQSMEFPINSIAGIEIANSEGTEVTKYYPQLILKRIYWRIPLDSDGYYGTAVTIAQIISQFLNVAYFHDESKAPIPTWRQKILEGAIPYQAHWKYLEDEIDRLRQYLSQHSQDAEVHQELGIFLHFSNRRNRQEAIIHIQKAENLFEIQQELDRVALAKIVKSLVSWKY